MLTTLPAAANLKNLHQSQLTEHHVSTLQTSAAEVRIYRSECETCLFRLSIFFEVEPPVMAVGASRRQKLFARCPRCRCLRWKISLTLAGYVVYDLTNDWKATRNTPSKHPATGLPTVHSILLARCYLHYLSGNIS